VTPSPERASREALRELALEVMRLHASVGAFASDPRRLSDHWEEYKRECSAFNNAERALANAAASHPSVLLALLDDADAIDWIREHATSVSDGYGPNGTMMHPAHSTHGRVLLTETTLPTVPRDEPDWTRAALRAARLPRPETPDHAE
jgi:hypothetical protein